MRTGEKIYNIFLFIKDGIIHEFGLTMHTHSGNDGAKMAFLRSQASKDYLDTGRFKVPDRFHSFGGFSYETFRTLQVNGAILGVFEEAFDAVGIPRDVLVCITPIVDGKPCVKGTSDLNGRNVEMLN